MGRLLLIWARTQAPPLWLRGSGSQPRRSRRENPKDSVAGRPALCGSPSLPYRRRNVAAWSRHRQSCAHPGAPLLLRCSTRQNAPPPMCASFTDMVLSGSVSITSATYRPAPAGALAVALVTRKDVAGSQPRRSRRENPKEHVGFPTDAWPHENSAPIQLKSKST